MKERNISIDILKCFAALVITNSHMELLYGKYSILATGGAIGDVLFFFCSGYTLFLGRIGGRFDNWYKRRINRIYPTIFAWALMSCMLFNYHYNMIHILLFGGGWFVSCIMLYYVVLYFIQRYLLNYLKWTFISVALGCAAWFFMADTSTNYNMYGYDYFKWFHYFLFMLMGAMMGMSPQKYNYNFGPDCIKLIGCIILFYMLYAFKNIPELNKFQMLTWFPLGGITFYFYKICNSSLLKRAYGHTILGWLIKLIGGLCLEIYLVQYALFTDKMNKVFPLNLFIMFVIIVTSAYILRCVSRVFAQTFKDMDYDWKAVFKAV